MISLVVKRGIYENKLNKVQHVEASKTNSDDPGRGSDPRCSWNLHHAAE